jgi:hypothetical protein
LRSAAPITGKTGQQFAEVTEKYGVSSGRYGFTCGPSGRAGERREGRCYPDLRFAPKSRICGWRCQTALERQTQPSHAQDGVVRQVCCPPVKIAQEMTQSGG